jgi:hypothetical protein
MNESRRDNGYSEKVVTVNDLATDLDKCTAWLAKASVDYETKPIKIVNVLIEAIITGRSDICHLILNVVHKRQSKTDFTWISTEALAFACYSGHLSVAQLIVNRNRPSAQHLYTALTNACTFGHVEMVTWLLGEMELSHSDTMRWMLATVSAIGDIDTVTLLAAQAGVTSTEAMSQALGVACYNGKAKVVDWLMMYTTADVSLCGELGVEIGLVTSLTAACRDGHANIVVSLLQCVTPYTVNLQCGTYNDSSLHFVIFYTNQANWNHSLHNACYRGDIRDALNTVYSTDVNMIDQSGSTPLHWACRYNNVDIVRILMSVFARDDITDNDKRTSIETANYYGNEDLVPYMSQYLRVTNNTPSTASTMHV